MDMRRILSFILTCGILTCGSCASPTQEHKPKVDVTAPETKVQVSDDEVNVRAPGVNVKVKKHEHADQN